MPFLENLANNTSIIDICWLYIYVMMDSKERTAEKNIPHVNDPNLFSAL